MEDWVTSSSPEVQNRIQASALLKALRSVGAPVLWKFARTVDVETRMQLLDVVTEGAFKEAERRFSRQ